MTATDPNICAKVRPYLRMVIVWLLAGATFGCITVKDTAKGAVRVASETSRKVSNVFTTAEFGLKAKIALIGIESQVPGRPIGFSPFFQKTIPGVIQTECPQLLIDETVGDILKNPPRLPSGQIDGYSLAQLGRPRGLNFFVIGTLSDVRLLDEKTGFWLWKDTRYKIQAVMRVEIIESAKGTKVIDETYSEHMEIDELSYQQLKDAGNIPFGEIDRIISRLMHEAGYTTCQALRNEPWQGFVLAVDQNHITLSSGSAIGLTSGKVLDVYDNGRMVESKDGQRFLKPGEKIGEATVSSVTEDRAEAIFNGSARVSAGGIVRSKR
jgi:hypothetical protein